MTVQSINNRVVADNSLTSTAQDKVQAAASVEDAFMAVLQQTSQRFGAQLGSNASAGADSMLAEHITRVSVSVKSDKPQAQRDDTATQRAPVTKASRPAAKADKPRAASSDDNSNAAASSDATAAPAAADDNAPAAAASDDGKAPAAKAQDDSNTAADSNGSQTAATTDTNAAANAVAEQQKAVVEIDITVEETITTVEVVSTGDQAAQIDPNQQAAQLLAGQAASGQNAAGAKDPLAGLSKDDRQRVNDLQKQIVADLNQGDAADALDAATQMVSQLAANISQQLNGTQNLHQGKATTATAQDQAKDLANMLAGSGAQMQVNVQVTQATQSDTTATQTAQTLLDAQAQIEQAAQTQVAAVDPNAGRAGQDQGQNANSQAQPDPTAVLTPVAGAPGQAAPVVEDTPKVFSAVLAAQMEAANQASTETAPTPQITGIANVGQPQAASQTNSAQSTAQTARAPRVPLQQQVMDQVNVQIDKAVKDGADVVKIQLKPHELGKIEIKLEVSADGHVNATVTAEKPETLALLQKDSKGLEKALENAGLKTDGTATSFNLKGQEHQQNADRGGNNSQRQGRGRAGGADLGEDPLAGSVQAAQSRLSGGRSGVDISV